MTKIKKMNAFTILITGATDNEYAADRIAAVGQEILHYHMQYVPLFKDFNELKTMLRAMQLSSAVKGKRITMVIDLSEWIGHEKDEYLTIAMKFFHDMQHRADYIFTVGNHSRADSAKLFSAARKYMRGTFTEDCTLTDTAALVCYIERRCATQEAAKLIAAMLRAPRMDPLLNIMMINDMCDEMLDLSSVGVIRPQDVSAYLKSEYSLPYVTDAKTALEFAHIADKELIQENEGISP